MNTYAERIGLLRDYMRSKHIDAVILYGIDPHCSEYVADRWKQIEWLTGFTGEAAEVVVTTRHAGLWTDSRYFIQANSQLEGTGVELHKTRIPGAVSPEEWLSENLPENSTVGIDSLCTTVSRMRDLDKRFNVEALPDFMDKLWTDRPAVPNTPVFYVSAGEESSDKIESLREFIRENGCNYMLLTALDEIAWVLNMRASDIDYNPLVISYLLIGQKDVKWFVIKGDLTEESASELEFLETNSGVQILPYYEIAETLNELSRDSVVFIDENTLNADVSEAINCRILTGTSPVILRKAQKNAFEIRSMRECHINDGVAMENFLYWLESRIREGNIPSEREAADKLQSLRSEIEDYMGDSFECISACGENAALPHYITPQENGTPMHSFGLYLNDSGGQYLSGTTDITRTIPLGNCSEAERKAYTLVLKAHIDLANAVFPTGTPGCRVDAAARLPLWRNLYDFGHGTGHGVGFFSGVHEGPTQIRQNLSDAPLLNGMILSNEPGIYKEGHFGIRLENLYLVEDAGSSEFGTFSKFSPLTVCHFDTSIILRDLLDPWEIDWLNNYNQSVYNTLCDYLEPDVRLWLEEKTKNI